MRFILKGLLVNIKSSEGNIKKRCDSVFKNKLNQIIKSPPNQVVKYSPEPESKLDHKYRSSSKFTDINNIDLYQYFKQKPENR